MHDMWVWCIGGMLLIGVNLSTWSKISSSTTFLTTCSIWSSMGSAPRVSAVTKWLIRGTTLYICTNVFEGTSQLRHPLHWYNYSWLTFVFNNTGRNTVNCFCSCGSCFLLQPKTFSQLWISEYTVLLPAWCTSAGSVLLMDVHNVLIFSITSLVWYSIYPKLYKSIICNNTSSLVM